MPSIATPTNRTTKTAGSIRVFTCHPRHAHVNIAKTRWSWGDVMRALAWAHAVNHGRTLSALPAQDQRKEINMLRRISFAGSPLTLVCFALIASATQAVAQQVPAIHVGSDTRAKSEAQCMNDAKFAITETGLRVSFTSAPHIGGAGTLEGAGVAVLVTCRSEGARTFIEVVGTSLNSSAAEQARNRVRTITMGPPS